MTLSLLLAVALAAEPEVFIDDGDWVRGSIRVSAPLADVRAILDDPERMAEIDGNDTEVHVVADGVCKRVATKLTRTLVPAEYVARACPRDGGWRYDLVESEDFRAHESEWVAMLDGDSVHITYAVRSVVAFPVPQWVVNRANRKATAHVLTAIAASLEPAPR